MVLYRLYLYLNDIIYRYIFQGHLLIIYYFKEE